MDIDLEKFFDRVNHDILMGRIAKRVDDKRMLKLIRAFLNAGVMENGLVSPTARARRKAVRFAATVEPGARRIGPGAGETRPPVRSLCGRL